MRINPDHEQDIRLFLDHYKPSEEDTQARTGLLDQLFHILGEHFGSGFDVEYVGIGRYAADINQAPLEVVIVDVQCALGIVGRDYTSDLPDIYSPSAVARTLAREGFHGRINNHSLSRTTTINLPATKEYVRPQQMEDTEDEEWLGFEHIPRRGLVYPERLRVEYPVAFDLILPGPATIPLVHMLEEYSKLFPAFCDLVSVSYLWCHSLGMREISPICLALLFVSFLQETVGMPGIAFPPSNFGNYNVEHQHTKFGNQWAVHEFSLGNDQWTDEIVALKTEFIIQTDTKYTDLDTSRLLRNFMNFLNRISKNTKAPIISVGTGRNISRGFSQYLGSTVKSLPNLLCKSADTPYASMRPPQLWKIHPLIVQDPFMYTHNHAEFVSIRTVITLAHNSQVAIGKIDMGHSLVEILGVEAISPTDALQRALVLQDEVNPVRPHVRLARSTTIRKVQDIVHRNFGNGYRVELFGSTSYGVDTATSDLDLVIMDGNRMDGFPPSLDLGSLPFIYNVNNLARVLRRAGFTNVLPIPSASVPIVKFKDPATGLECDININDQLGFINTSMVKYYVSLQPVLILLLRLIKRWAKSVGMNSPSKRPVSFSSYALTLMTIAWFQSLGWLPNLQGDVPVRNIAPADHFWIKNRNGERFRCDTRFMAVENWSIDTGKSVGELFFEWLGFWGWEFDYDECIVCIRRGGMVPRKGNNARKNQHPVVPTSTQVEEQESLDDEQDEEADEEVVPDESFDADWSRNFMCVADPFVVTKNCTGQINKFVFTRFVHECRNTEGMLQLGISLETILSREPPLWKFPPRRPKKGMKQANNNKGKQAEERRAPTEEPKPRSRFSRNARRGRRGGSSGTQTRVQANNP